MLRLSATAKPVGFALVLGTSPAKSDHASLSVKLAVTRAAACGGCRSIGAGKHDHAPPALRSHTRPAVRHRQPRQPLALVRGLFLFLFSDTLTEEAAEIKVAHNTLI